MAHSDADSPEPVRIAFVVLDFEPGGLERCVANLCNHLDPARFQPSIVCLGRGGGASAWLDEGRCEVVSLNRRAAGLAPRVVALARLLRERRIEVVHSHNWMSLLEAVAARRLAGVRRHVHAEHGKDHTWLAKTGVARRLHGGVKRLALGSPDRVVVVSASVRAHLVESCGFESARIDVLGNGVSMPLDGSREAARRARRAELGLEPSTVLLGSVGRLAPVKGLEVLIDGAARLRSQGIKAHLVVVGDGPERAALAERAARMLGPAVSFVGHSAAVGEWLAAMDVYLNTSVSEGMCLAVIEAMALGLPCVVSDVGDNRVLVDPHGDGELAAGLVAADRTADSVAEAVARLIATPGLAERLGRNGQARYRRDLTVNRMVARYEDLYSELERKASTR